MAAIKYFISGIKTIINFLLKCIKYFFIGLITIIAFFPHYIIIGIKFIFSKNDNNNHEEKKIEKKFIPITILTLSITTYLISIFILTRWYVQNERTKNFTSSLNSTPILEEITETTPDQYEDLTTTVPAPDTPTNSQPNTPTTKPQQKPTTSEPKINTNYINVNLKYYIQKNPETVAWIQVNGTKVNYPVVQHSNNDYYLKHDFYKRKTTNGWIFGDYRNDFKTFDNNTIIYGHNLINNTMFGTLTNLLNKNFLINPNNHYIKLSTQTTNTVWQIFSVYKIKPTTDYLQAKFNSTTAYQNFLDLIKKRSYYNFNTSLNYTDKIITLSTCDDTGTKRVVIHAKLINIESK